MAVLPFYSACHPRDVIFHNEGIHKGNRHGAKQRASHQRSPEEYIPLDQFAHHTNGNGLLLW